MEVVIIGAGVGGTALAARLAKGGAKVTVLEQNDHSGGRCSILRQGGFRFDQGPSLWLMPEVFEETFRDLGEELSDHIKLVKCDPNYSIHFQDGRKLTLTTDMAKLRTELEAFEENSFDGLLRFMREGRLHYETSLSMVLKRNYEYWWNFFTVPNLLMGLRLHVLTTLWSRVGIYFKDMALKQAFTFQSMYMGMSPYESPGTYNLLQYTELAEGIFYPIGGFHSLIDSLESIAKKHGAEFLYNSPVASIDVSTVTNLTSGVTLSDGTKFNADVVICNCDLVTAYNRLLPPSPYARYLGSLDQTCSTISFYWGLDRKVPGLNGHNVFLADDYKESFDAIFKKFGLPTAPSFYLHVPSKVDSTAAPEGKEALTVLVPIGHIKPGVKQEWKALRAKARSAVLATIAALVPGCESIADWIETEVVNTPEDWKEKFSLWNGSALGLSHNVTQVVYMRPSTRHAEFGNLFFVGASTHPGTGVPIVLCGAKLVECQIKQIVQSGSGFRHKLYLFGMLRKETFYASILGFVLMAIIFGTYSFLFQYLSPLDPRVSTVLKAVF
ncbi:hypothetical protein HDU67_007920 [Dinochytrium kinnereticum]|nr:hypothetical protein HDU67_007920 [Dinochytrium kinnereticum]